MTRVPLALKLAWRYLTAPKSHGAVSAISIISIVGVAVATAAIVIVLSVFNGFRTHLNHRLDSLTTDISITPAHGKTILDGDSLAEALSQFPGVGIAMPSVTDNALVIANSKEMPITLKGVVPGQYARITSIDSLLMDGSPVADYTPEDASISIGVAQRLGIYGVEDNLLIFTPRRIGRINPANPASSFLTDSVKISSIFRSLQNDFDENTVICDIETARELFQYETEASSIEIQAEPGISLIALTQNLSDHLGDEFVVKDRFEQQEVSFRMVKIEKWITFLLLAFILLIASFNIISTLCMLIIEKQTSITTLSDIGLNKRRIGGIFWWESLLVTFTGGIIGLILGVGLSLLQEKYGFIKLAGDPEALVVQAYPVMVEWLDLAITFVPVLIIGMLTAFIARRFAMTQAAARN